MNLSTSYRNWQTVNADVAGISRDVWRDLIAQAESVAEAQGHGAGWTARSNSARARSK